MMKNNRPYSIENGKEDAALITDRPEDEMNTALSWIKENISPAEEPLMERSSYGMKHLLQHDTKLYLTNNEFKDAMLLCGFEPVDPDELNWHYCIDPDSYGFDWEAKRAGMTKDEWDASRKEKEDNMNFYKYMMDNHLGEESPAGDLANDMKWDRDFFPVDRYGDLTDGHRRIRSYLERSNACDACIEVFERCWDEYIKAWEKRIDLMHDFRPEE